MSNILKIAGEVIVGAALIAVTAGVGAGLIAGASLGSAIAGSTILLSSALGIGLGSVLAIGAGLTLAGGLLAKKPQVSPAQEQRTKVSLELNAPRKIVFGHTALGTDLRYQELWGAQQEYVTQILLVASHWCESIDEVWINDQLGWSSGGGTDAAFTNYFFVAPRAQAAPGSPYLPGWSNRWGDNACFTGCATLLFTWRVQGYGAKATSPFASSIPTRITVRGKGARVYDPRQDSTAGGSGAMRASDQATWAFAPGGVEIGRNPALCLLFYLLGWRIQNPVSGVWKLAVGLGVPADRIDLASFITAANFCDETVTLAAGGTEPRYRCDGMFSEADDPLSVITALEACMNGKLRDSAGRFSLQAFHNDLAVPVLDLTADDLLDDFIWDAGGALNELKNVIKGRYVDPSNSSLYQMVDAPAVKLPSLDGIDRIETFDLALVQSPSQAQRLRKARLQRYQYPGTFAGTFKARAWALKDGDVVRFTLPALGFSLKLFRATKVTVQVSGAVPLVLAEENGVIYSWDQEEAPAVVAAEPIRFDPVNEPIRLAIDDAARTAAWDEVTGGGKPEDHATRNEPAGLWSSGTAYHKGDIVSANGASYTAKQDVPTGIGINNATYWQPLASKGDDGDKGDKGDPGTNGVSPSPKYGAINVNSTGTFNYPDAIVLASGQSVNFNVVNFGASYTSTSSAPVTVTVEIRYSLNNFASYSVLDSQTYSFSDGDSFDMGAGGSYTAGSAVTLNFRVVITRSGGSGTLSFYNGAAEAS